MSTFLTINFYINVFFVLFFSKDSVWDITLISVIRMIPKKLKYFIVICLN